MRAIKAKSDGIIHVQTRHQPWDFIPIRDEPHLAKGDCGFVGRIVEVDFASDPREICGRCLWRHYSEHQHVDLDRYRRRPEPA